MLYYCTNLHDVIRGLRARGPPAGPVPGTVLGEIGPTVRFSGFFFLPHAAFVFQAKLEAKIRSEKSLVESIYSLSQSSLSRSLSLHRPLVRPYIQCLAMASLSTDHENDSEVSSVFSQHPVSNRPTVGATGTYIPASLPASLVQPNLVSAPVTARLTRARERER